MAHPYSDLPDQAFWRRAVSGVDPDDIDPVASPPFTISPADRVATAGSCFAQRLSRAIAARGFNFLVTEAQPGTAAAADENYGVFSARYGNIYTTTQFLQLFERAYGLFAPQDDAWIREDGAAVDPFRPRIQAAGFPSIEAMRADREAHLVAVRTMLETCDVLVFTLGLTECWVSEADGAVVPLPPGVAGSPSSGATYRFRNLGAANISNDLLDAVDRIRRVNPAVRIILTVSPVAIVATQEPRHVLVSNGYSKAALRVAAETVCLDRPDVSYFPGYEIVAGPAGLGRYIAADRRHVTEEGVEHVVALFARHYLGSPSPRRPVPRPVAVARAVTDREPFAPVDDLVALQGVVCDEESLDR